MRAFGLQFRQLCLLFGRQFRAAEDEIAQVVVELGFLCGGEGGEFGGIFDGFEAVVQLDVLSDFGEEDGDFGHQFVIDGAQFGRVNHRVEVRHDAPNSADAFGNVGQTLDGVCPVGVRLGFDFGNLRARFGDGGLQGGFDVGGLDGVETGFFAQMEQYVVGHGWDSFVWVAGSDGGRLKNGCRLSQWENGDNVCLGFRFAVRVNRLCFQTTSLHSGSSENDGANDRGDIVPSRQA